MQAVRYILVIIVAMATACIQGQSVCAIPQPLQVVLRGDSVDMAHLHNPVSVVTGHMDELGEEGYRLVIEPDTAYVLSCTPRGNYYGLLTYAQMLHAAHSSGHKIPCCRITDYPAYHYRGMHLDVCRHFFSVDFIKKYIDELAYYKINTLHWHLTDDQGWRIEIRKYPQLTETGAWRIEKDGKRYGGYYTQAEIRDIVDYAAARYITIIPEIEMPGHSSAALAAYPYLGCTGRAIGVPHTWGIKRDIYAPTDTVFGFFRDVMDEVCALFPSHYIHIGGDEAPKAQWRSSPIAQAVIREQHLAGEQELQYYFMHHVERYLSGKGRRAIGWGEVVRGGLSDSITVMSWLSYGAGVKAARHGNDAIMAPRTFCYLDYPQTIRDPLRAIWMLYLPLRKAYHYDPMPRGLTDSEQRHILGGEATLWTEYVTTEQQAWHQLLPRLAALSEAMWTKQERKDYRDFCQRLTTIPARH
jgi:hexosaminidase